MKTYRIATIPGDGIGKEVIPAGRQVLEALAAAGAGFGLAFTVFDWGRDHYRRHLPLTREAQGQWCLNPGQGNVGSLCHEPWVAVAAIDTLLAPFVADGRLTVLRRHRLARVDSRGDRVAAVTVSAPSSRPARRTRPTCARSLSVIRGSDDTISATVFAARSSSRARRSSRATAVVLSTGSASG